MPVVNGWEFAAALGALHPGEWVIDVEWLGEHSAGRLCETRSSHP